MSIRNEYLNPVEYKDGYYCIPGYTKYVINKSGDVKQVSTWKSLTQNTTKSYNIVTLPRDENEYPIITKQVKVHRLVALTFLDPGIYSPQDLQVNHKDTNRRNNNLYNLEWVTPSENLQYALNNRTIGQDIVSRPVEIYNPISGTITYFKSIIDCSKTIKIHRDAIRHRLKMGPLYIFPEGYQYRDSDFGTPWPVPNIYDRTDYTQYGVSKAVLVREWKNNCSIQRFATTAEAAKYLGLGLSTLSLRLDRGAQVMCPGLVEVKYDNYEPWEYVDDPWLALQRDFPGTKIIQAINTKTNEKEIYESLVECAEARGLKPTTLSERIKNNNNTLKVFSDGYRYGYYPFD